ncbi:FkbM family methyltransferase [Marinibacterium profundimaris]|uniref:FkbM family methyltransferase n=1 Tax=Marinibacterium profundimaris TaxID=1679460 RepID=UPI001303852F|nr:FkbM family methyltransferase [Marinibacterium profundimaris]
MNDVSELEGSISYRGPLRMEICGHEVSFDLSNPHEVRYVLRALTGLPHPQADIDHKLFETFVRDGDVCLDIGANIGMTALEMLSLGAARVIAFEPVASLADRLRAMAVPSVEVHGIALSDCDGMAEIILSQSHNQGHTLSAEQVAQFPKVFGDRLRRQTVRTSRLDQVFDNGSAGDLWKIDAEGAEHAVLRGAARLLSEEPPRVILCECYAGVDDLAAILGPDWGGARALLRSDTGALALGPLDTPGDDRAFRWIAPTYVFYRKDAVALPAGMTFGGV